MIVFIIIVAVIVIALVVTNIRIVPQANAYVVERLGAYMSTWEVGLHVKIPLIDKIAKNIAEGTCDRFSSAACHYEG